MKKIKINNLKHFLLPFLSFGLIACEPAPIYAPTPTTALSGKYEYCNDTVPFGFPQFKNIDKKRDENIIFSCHDNYTLAYRTDYEIAYWTAEHLKGVNVKNFKNTDMRQDRMRMDVNFDTDFNADFDFGTAQDQGWIYRPFVATKNYLGNERMMSKTYYWTNMFPYPRDWANLKKYEEYLKKVEKAEQINAQRLKEGKTEDELIKIPEFKFDKDNSTILWNNVEQKIRDLTEKYDEVYIFSGSVFYSNKSKEGYVARFGTKTQSKGYDFNKLYEVGEAGKLKTEVSEIKFGLVAPSHIFKMLYFPKQKQTIVYIIPNTREKINSVNPEDYRQNLETLENITQINFFPYKK